MGQETHDKLLHAQALLRHQVPSGELAEIFDRALDHNQLEAERVFGAEFMAPQTRGGAPA